MVAESVQLVAPLTTSLTSGAFRVVRDELEDVRAQLADLKAEVRVSPARGAECGVDASGVSLVVFSGDLDRLLAAMHLATASAAMGEAVNLFFTFWGTCALRKPRLVGKRPLLERMFGWMLPAGSRKLKLSRMNMGGMGTALVRRRMATANMDSLEELFSMAGESGVNMFVCETSMELLGLREEDLIDYPGMTRCGAVTFLSEAMGSRLTLFI